MAIPAAAEARTLYGTTSDGKLVQFNDKAAKVKTATKQAQSSQMKKKKPAKVVQVKSTRKIVDLPAGVTLRGIDFRPKTGELWGAGSNGILYKLLLSEPKTAQALQVSAATTTTLNGSSFGVDFNPVPDALRIVSDAGQNLRVTMLSTATTTNTDTPLNPAPQSIVGAGYSNSGFSFLQPGAGTTTLFTVNSTTDTLGTQGGVGGNPNPNLGQVFPVGPLGIDIGTTVGFDVTGPFGNPAGLLTNAANGKTTLYRVNVINGSTTKVGDVVTLKKGKTKKTTLTGLAAVQG